MKWVTFIGILLFFISCQKNRTEITLTNENLVKVLTDLHIAETATLSFPKKEQDSVKAHYLNQILELHQLTEPELNQNLEALYAEKERYKMVYDTVIAQLNAVEKSFYKENGSSDDPEEEVETINPNRKRQN